MLHLGYQPCQHPNVYPTPPGNYRSFRTSDGLVICRRCNQVGHCASACSGNLPPRRAPTHQNHRDDYVPPAPPNIYSHHTLSIAPQINIPKALSIDHIPIDTILWAILARAMPPTPILHDDHHSHSPIKPTSTKLEGLIFQPKQQL